MNKQTRNTLRNTVTQCRRFLEESIAELLQGQFGIHPSGKIEDAEQLSHLSEEDRDYRVQILVHLQHITAGSRGAGAQRSRGAKTTNNQLPITGAAVEQLIREVAFTHLNRLAAYKMMETRGLIRQAVSRGLKSQGFLFYLADHPEDEQLWSSGQQDVAYRHFLIWLGSTLSEEIGVLFSPHDPANRLLPPQRVLDQVLDLLNSDDLAGIWDQDETIGWVYQYFTPKELRDQARKESQAPRNSYELAFRNQFYTPRYVVQFLTDNTLGRIWYEMRRGDTALVEQCQYLVRRPNEVFLAEGENGQDLRQDLQDEKIKENNPVNLVNPVYIPFRAKKDPRQLKILDPACGSGHFLLYCFDLLETIYEEAYNDPDLGPALQADYPTLADLRQAVPALILRHNLHGIDIDPRAVQIASLALWLKAKKSLAALDPSSSVLRPSSVAGEAGRMTKDDGRITRTNIVTAEPMPGSKDLLDEFCADLQPPVLGQLVKAVFHKMELAGEAGALLKIEEELTDAIAAAKKQWLTGPQPEQLTFWPDAAPPPRAEQLNMFDVSSITDEQFWEQAEELVLAALRDYAEQVANGAASTPSGGTEGGQLARRLFAEDAAQGFAFIDLCRQKFDVVLMNPPFGAASKPSKAYIEDMFPRTKNDVYAIFVERWLMLLNGGGRLGSITSRTGFFLSSFDKWREEILLNQAWPVIFADLGYGVLDTAMVETAAYCLSNQTNGEALFFRLLTSEDKTEDLTEAIAAIHQGKDHPIIFSTAPTSFLQVSGSPFAYWVSERIRHLFAELPSFENDERTVRVGLQTGDDFRFVRTWWEVAPDNIAFGSTTETPADFRQQTFTGKRWAFFAKGGPYSPFYADLHLVVNWEKDGSEIRDFVNPETGRLNSRPQNTTFYFRPGLTWAYRTHRICLQELPKGVIISVRGSGVFADLDTLRTWLGLGNSIVLDFLLKIAMGREGHPQFDQGDLKLMPYPQFGNSSSQELWHNAKKGLSILRYFAGTSEVSLQVILPALLKVRGDSLTDRTTTWQSEILKASDSLAEIEQQLDITAFKVYGIDGVDRETIKFGLDSDLSDNEYSDYEKTLYTMLNIEPIAITAELVSYSIGCIFARWDIRIALDPSLAPSLQDPFDPLPVCPPAMLVGPEGRPATPGRIVSEEWLRARPNAISLPPEGSVKQPTIPDEAYPLAVDWDGILVDDPDHPDDIVRRVREVIELLWGEGSKGTKDDGRRTMDESTHHASRITEHASRNTPPPTSEDIEQEACEILGVKELRDYFRKSGKGGFWDDHVKRYSKSRRKAPIYWLLQSSKKNYALWLYYHRLDKDLLYKALVNYVEPKIRLEEGKLEQLRRRRAGAGTSGREAKQLEKELADQEDFVAELHDFAGKLRRAANLNLSPDLNDGVVLNIAPLWELAPWKETQKYWEQLLDGKYEWSSIGQQLREKGLVKG